MHGFRNKTLSAWLDPHWDQRSPHERQKLSAKVTRLIAILRAHKLIRKVTKENRYVLTKTGQEFAHALVAASTLELQQLTPQAA